MSDEDASILGDLWDAGEAAFDAMGHVTEAVSEGFETAGDALQAGGIHAAATAAFAVGATDTANEWEQSAEEWGHEMVFDGGQVYNEGLGVVDSVLGTDYYDESASDNS